MVCFNYPSIKYSYRFQYMKKFVFFLVSPLVACSPITEKIDSNVSMKIDAKDLLMCAEKTGGFNLVNYRHSSGVYHEQETEDLHRRI